MTLEEPLGRSIGRFSPVTRLCTVSAMLVAWSPARSMFFEQKSRCVQNVMLRGSSIMKVKEVAKHGILQRIEFGISKPHVLRLLHIAARIGVEHVLQLQQGQIASPMRSRALTCGCRAMASSTSGITGSSGLATQKISSCRG
jgi:hypothetical protein